MCVCVWCVRPVRGASPSLTLGCAHTVLVHYYFPPTLCGFLSQGGAWMSARRRRRRLPVTCTINHWSDEVATSTAPSYVEGESREGERERGRENLPLCLGYLARISFPVACVCVWLGRLAYLVDLPT